MRARTRSLSRVIPCGRRCRVAAIPRSFSTRKTIRFIAHRGNYRLRSIPDLRCATLCHCRITLTLRRSVFRAFSSRTIHPFAFSYSLRNTYVRSLVFSRPAIEDGSCRHGIPRVDTRYRFISYFTYVYSQHRTHLSCTRRLLHLRE